MSWTFTYMLIGFVVFASSLTLIEPLNRWLGRRLEEMDAKEAEAKARQERMRL